MGRKKKQNIQAKTTQNIGYEGNIKVSIQKGKKIISTKEYHNSGCPNLFKFLCYALKGDFVNELRPNRIALYKSNDGDKPSEFTFPSANITAPTVLASGDISVDPSADNITLDSYYTATYQFRIPYAYISGNNISAIALVKNNFNNNYSEAANELCAIYKFTKAGEDEFDPIKIEDKKLGNYSLIIDWKLTIKNPGTTQAY